MSFDKIMDQFADDDYAAIDRLAAKFYSNSVDHGFWDGVHHNIDQKLMLIVGEVTEAHEEIRSGHAPTDVYFSDTGKPEGVPTELADIIIRVLDLAAYLGIDIGSVLKVKHSYNVGRPMKHGRKF
jgi:NTP pyrophosphatase (non-canonical NTP hydrolase)